MRLEEQVKIFRTIKGFIQKKIPSLKMSSPLLGYSQQLVINDGHVPTEMAQMGSDIIM